MPSNICFSLFSSHSGQISLNSVNSTCPITAFEKEACYRNGSASFCLQTNYKHVAPSLRIMSTQGSHCDVVISFLIVCNFLYFVRFDGDLNCSQCQLVEIVSLQWSPFPRKGSRPTEIIIPFYENHFSQ